MTKKVSIIGIFGAMAFLLLCFVMFKYQKRNDTSRIYKKYQYPNEDVYGKELYSEIDYRCSEEEAEVGEMIVAQAFQVAEYTGTAQDSEKEMGDCGGA